MTEPKTTTKSATSPSSAAANLMTAQADQMMSTAKASMEQAVSHSRDALESGLRTVNVTMELGRGQVEALMASSKAASSGMQAMAMDVADYCKNSLERTSQMAQTMTHARSTPELMQAQGEFARSQFAYAVAEYSKLTQSMLHTMTAMLEPLQHPAVTSDQVEAMLKDR